MDKQISNSNKTMLVHTPLNEPLNSSKHSQEKMDLQSWNGPQILPICLRSKISGHTSKTSSVSNILIQQHLKDPLEPSKRHCNNDYTRSGGTLKRKC